MPTMNKSILALLIQEASADARPIRDALAQDKDHAVRLQCVERLSTALARIAGGGVDLVLLDLSASKAQEGGMDSLLHLLREAPQVPTVVICGADEGLALKAMRAGATDYVLQPQLGAGLGRVLHASVELARNPLPPTTLKMPERGTGGGIIAFLGAKGGVGTTTVALNIASTLARRSTVILVEMRPTFGSLTAYLQPHGTTRNLSHWLNSDSCASNPAAAAATLWAYKNVPGLSILFGPQTADECAEIQPEQAKAIIQSLAQMADYVIVDLPASLSAANRTVIENSGATALVVERDPVCVQSARLMARAIESWDAAGQRIGAVIVNRASISSPMPLPEINTILACQVFGVIPPGADLCSSAQKACLPLVAFYPESLVAGSLNALSEILATSRFEVPFRSLGSDRFRA
jgi:MinD-like ATPase involved in chromosome partitioning or flagellar assembly